MSEHYLDRTVSTSRWNNQLPPRLTIAPGDTLTMETRDASDAQVYPGMTAEAFADIDTTRIHGLTGPVEIEGAEPGDQLEIKILDFEHEGWAWTSIIPGLGLLENEFSDHFLHHWKLDGLETTSLPGIRLHLHPFAGIIGVQLKEEGEFRTRPPGVNGGNMDVKHLVAGSTLYLPVATPGAGLCAGDCHAAQGDGEVSINGMEAPMKIQLQVNLIKDRPLSAPYAITPGRQIPAAYMEKPMHTFIESGPDPKEAARRAVLRAIDYITGRTGLSREQAYVLCSVVLDLKISQWVNVPTVTISGYLPEAVFID